MRPLKLSVAVLITKQQSSCKTQPRALLR